MNPLHRASNPASPTPDRFTAYDQKWSITFKDCYLAWLKSERVPLRRFLITCLLLFLAGAVLLARGEAPPAAYHAAFAMTTLVVGVAVYLHHLEKRKN